MFFFLFFFLIVILESSSIDFISLVVFFLCTNANSIKKCQKQGHTLSIQMVYNRSATRLQKRKKRPREREG